MKIFWKIADSLDLWNAFLMSVLTSIHLYSDESTDENLAIAIARIFDQNIDLMKKKVTDNQSDKVVFAVKIYVSLRKNTEFINLFSNLNKVITSNKDSSHELRKLVDLFSSYGVSFD